MERSDEIKCSMEFMSPALAKQARDEQQWQT